MGKRGRAVMLAAALSCCTAHGAGAAIVTFDLETVNIGTFTPFTQVVGGVTASFSSPGGFAYSVQTDQTTFFQLSTLSGRYVYPNNLGIFPLDVAFSTPVDSISLVFASAEAHIASSLFVDLFLGINPVASTTAPGGFIPGDTYPQGALPPFAPGQPFDRVRLTLPAQGAEPAVAFMVDTIVVNTVSNGGGNGGAPVVPEPGTLAMVSLGVAALLRRKHTGQ